MKKLILAMVLSAFGVSSAYACDGMKGQAKGDKTDHGDSHGSQAKKDKGATKSDQKS